MQIGDDGEFLSSHQAWWRRPYNGRANSFVTFVGLAFFDKGCDKGCDKGSELLTWWKLREIWEKGVMEFWSGGVMGQRDRNQKAEG
jgi:hypothetical protein